MIELNSSTRQRLKSMNTQLEQQLAEMQSKKQYGKVIVQLDVKLGGVCDGKIERTEFVRLEENN